MSYRAAPGWDGLDGDEGRLHGRRPTLDIEPLTGTATRHARHTHPRGRHWTGAASARDEPSVEHVLLGQTTCVSRVSPPTPHNSGERCWACSQCLLCCRSSLQHQHVGRPGRPIRWPFWGQISTSPAHCDCEHVGRCCPLVLVAGIILPPTKGSRLASIRYRQGSRSIQAGDDFWR